MSGEQIFSDYAYFSSFSDSWLVHAEQYTTAIVDKLGLGSESRVVEVGSNDGHLLRHFVERQIPCLGIEPAVNVARAAVEKGVRTLVDFFGSQLATELASKNGLADLLIGNNVLAQVPKLNDFVAGLKILLEENGVITLEFPYLMRLIEDNQFDTIYHEHYSYLSLSVLQTVFAAQGLITFDVEQLSTHGGLLRVYAGHTEDWSKQPTDRYRALIDSEVAAGLTDLEYYEVFTQKVEEAKYKLLEFLIVRRGLAKRWLDMEHLARATRCSTTAAFVLTY